MKAETSSEFLTTRELMELLRVKHRQTIYKLISDGLPAVAIGKSYRFLRRDVMAFLRAGSRARKGVHGG